MAASLITTRLRTRLSGTSFLARITGAYQRGRAPLFGDGLDANTSVAGHGSQFYSNHEIMGKGLVWPSSSAVLCRLQHAGVVLGSSNLNLSVVLREGTATAAGIPGYPRGIGSVRNQHTDEWLVQRALADRKRRQAKRRIRPQRFVDGDVDISIVNSRTDSLLPVFSGEEKIANVLGRPDLIITRNVEWGNVAFGFEQQNKYVIMDPREPQAPVGYILEESNVLLRQFLRTRRPFEAKVLDAHGNEICRVRRPVWLINSTIFVEVDGKVIGEAHRRWHLWKRVYDCYLGEKQFAGVENPGFWYWTFTLHDENQGVLAVIDRNWRGFGYEFLTDAGQYVVRFGDSVPDYGPSEYGAPFEENVRISGRPILSGSSSALAEMQNLRTAAAEAQELIVARPLSLLERAVVLALAVSLDNDYFSNHSSGFGFIPLPFFGGSEAVDSVAPTQNDASVSEAPADVSTNDSPEELWEEDASFQDDTDILVDPFDVGTDNW